jgi:hypothetical protein
VVKRYLIPGIVILALAASVHAQQKPATAADRAAADKAAAAKAAADQKAGEENMARMAAQQAEAVARAQQKVAEEARRRDLERARDEEAKISQIIPLDLEVVISRYQGDKKTSSLPYSLAVNASIQQEKTSLRMGANVPVPTTSFTPVQTADGKPAPSPLVSYNYQDIGTNIDCSARPLGDGRFVVSITASERSVVQSGTNVAGAVAGAPVIRNFSASNSLVLRDGQTRQFTAAADRITGEVVKIDVTLKVAK